MLDTISNNYNFKVLEEKAYLADGTAIPDMKILRHPDTGYILGKHSSNYKPINYEEMVENLLVGLDNSNISKDYTTNIKIHSGGRKLKASVLFNDITINPSPQLNDLTHYRINMFSSHDGTWPYIISADGLRLTCLNGQTFADPLSKIRLKHTSRVSIEDTARHVLNNYETFKDKEEMWSEYAKTNVYELEVEGFFKDYIVKKKTYSSLKDNNERQLENLMSLYHDHSSWMGHNKWSLYNCLTAWATHTDFTDNSGKRMAKSPHNTSVEREAIIAKAINTNCWNALGRYI
tara:strand:+ start:1382 stop:2251 length:870 start_codon:yes stop_codon:yes gene_type:complete